MTIALARMEYRDTKYVRVIALLQGITGTPAPIEGFLAMTGVS